MSVGLNPVVQEKLDQVARRRRRLVLARGVSAAIVSFLLVMPAIAAADWTWVLPDRLRWGLSAIGYAGILATVWWTSLRLVARGLGRRELARRVEAVEPGLRENLLAAVELAADPNPTYDSPVFRRLLQERVGSQMTGLDVRCLLPGKLVRSWLIVATLLASIATILLLAPGFPFRQLMLRAILPGANVDRVSQIRVAVLEPATPSITLPQDETAAVVVEISGGKVDNVDLEAETLSSGVVRQPMHAHGPSQFAVNLAVGKEPIDYRILAGDAVTRKYTIRSQPRPSALDFHKTYRYPKYAGMADRTVTEAQGDLVALEGSRADLLIDVDQEVSRAEIRLERSGAKASESVELTPAGTNRLHAAIDVTAPGVYTVHLVARETGFENTFSPKYEIRPQPDAPPRVGFVGQQDTTLLLPPNDLLTLKALAEDDLPLVGVEQLVSVNGGEWKRVPLKVELAPRVTATWDWDLLKLHLRSGDQVITKLVATDRKGSTGESTPLQVVIAPPDVDPQRYAVMNLKAGLYDDLARLAVTIEQHQASATALVERLNGQDVEKTGTGSEPKAGGTADRAPSEVPVPVFSRGGDTARRTLLDLAEKMREEADKVFQHVVRILPQMPAGADAEEVELAGRTVARIEHDAMRIPDVSLDAAHPAADAAQAAKDLEDVKNAFQRSAENARRLETRYRDLLTHNILAAIGVDLDGLRRHQEQLFAPGAPLSWQRLLRQETVATAQLHVLERVIQDNATRLRASAQPKVESMLQWVRSSRERLEASMESPDQESSLRKAGTSLVSELEWRRNVTSIDGRLLSGMVEARQELDALAGDWFPSLDRLAQAGLAAGRSAAVAGQAKDASEARKATMDGQRAAAEWSRWQSPSLTHLKARRSANQSRRDGDPQYVADAGLTGRAVRALLDRHASEPVGTSEVPSILARLAPACRILEAGHEVVDLRAALAHLLVRERWDAESIAARLDHPRQWDSIHERFASIAAKLREAGLPNEVVAKLKSLRESRSAQETKRKIGSRRCRQETPTAPAYELDDLEKELAAVVEGIRPAMAEARALIAQYAPPIPEMAKRASGEVRRVEEKTVALTDQEPRAAAKADGQLHDLKHDEQAVNERIEELTDALVDDANTQDLLTEEGRQRARDADDSIAMIREPAARMNQAIERAAAKASADRSRDLAEAAEHQERTARALDRVADHFQRLASGQDVADSREALRQAEKELGIAGPMDQRYQPAERLGQIADKSPQELLAELEARLPKDASMQEALSAISQETLEQARNALERSADQEDAVRRSIERSDRDYQAKKKPLVREIRDLAERASDLERGQVAQADAAVARGEAPKARERLQAGQRSLAESAGSARRVGDDSALDDVVQAARQMADRLGEAARDLAASRDLLSQATRQKTTNTEAERAQRQRELEAGQQRFHDQRLREARDTARGRARSQKQAADQVKSAETSLRKAETQIAQAEKDLEDSRRNRQARRSMEQALGKRAKAVESLDRARQRLAETQKEAAEADEEARRLEQVELRPLASPNPAAEMALRFTDEASRVAEELAKRAKELAAEPTWSKDLRPEPDELRRAASQQQEVGQQVSNAAADVARAGRHEERLGKRPLAEQLARKAGDVQGVSQAEVTGSERQLREAAEDAGANERPSTAARDSVRKAQDAISGQAEALGKILSASPPATADQPAQMAEAAQQPAPFGTSPSASASPSAKAEGRLLARTLDELDRALTASPANGQPSGSQAGLPGLAQAAEDQAAGLAQARSQAPTPAAAAPSTQPAAESANGAPIVATSNPDFSLTPVNRQEAGDWGKLRGQSAEDLTEGRREGVPSQYRTRVETYFRVIAERARQKP